MRFLVRVGGSVEGLAVGAPVTMRGYRVGTVREVAVTFDTGTGRLDVPVVIDIVPGSLIIDGQRPETADGLLDAVATLVRRGLRAQLASPSLLAASREVALDLVPDATPTGLGDGTPPEIPSQP
ncbi:MlaD family protein, partial [Streptomyces calidiresistens]